MGNENFSYQLTWCLPKKGKGIGNEKFFSPAALVRCLPKRKGKYIGTDEEIFFLTSCPGACRKKGKYDGIEEEKICSPAALVLAPPHLLHIATKVT